MTLVVNARSSRLAMLPRVARCGVESRKAEVKCYNARHDTLSLATRDSSLSVANYSTYYSIYRAIYTKLEALIVLVE